MAPVQPLAPADLYRHCDLSQLDFSTTDELEPLTGFIGQERAIEAVEVGIGIDLPGYNLFLLGPPGTGRHTFIHSFLEQQAAGQPAASDWCYVNNFNEPQQPRALELPARRGRRLRDDIEKLIGDLQATLSSTLESEDYRRQRRAVWESFQEQQGAGLREVRNHAHELAIEMLETPTGFAFAPVRDDEILNPQAYKKLSQEEQEQIQQAIATLTQELQQFMQTTPPRVRAAREKVRQLDRQIASFAVGSLIDDLLKAYADLPDVTAYVQAMREDLVDNIGIFWRDSGDPDSASDHGDEHAAAQSRHSALERYAINLLVDQDNIAGAPVVFEKMPNYPHLIGKIEHVAEYGALVTNFHLIRAGALHRANGGFLVLDAVKVLTEPFAWDALKRTLKAGHIRVESLGQEYGLVSTVSLEPEEIPLRLKVILVGERRIYYLLKALDPEFAELFKIAADFEDRMERTNGNEALLARILATLASQENLKPLEHAAVARVIEDSARYASDAERLSTQLRHSADLIREAHFWASKHHHTHISTADVDCAIDAGIRRNSRLRDRIRDETLRGTLLIDTDGERVGQVNGLSVMQLGDFDFGHPTRISARVTLGSGKVIDIEREVELGGPIHSKGVLILAGLLSSHYVTDRPLSLSATLVFEQSYGGVDGDSASSAELYALLSALTGIPLKQSLAVTGSINQYGEIQAIGGVNEKVEGFFGVCQARGLTGLQGVLIPQSNVKHLMLRQEVIDAVAQQRFHIYPVTHIDEGLELLTGIVAGEPGPDGQFPAASLNQRIRASLIGFADRRRAFGASTEEKKQ